MNADASKDKITLFHCNTEYPTPFLDINLCAMKIIAEEFGVCNSVKKSKQKIF